MAVARKIPRAKDEWVSLGAAAKALGEVRQTVLTRAVAGELKAKLVAGRTVVDRASLDRAVAAKRAAR